MCMCTSAQSKQILYVYPDGRFIWVCTSLRTTTYTILYIYTILCVLCIFILLHPPGVHTKQPVRELAYRRHAEASKFACLINCKFCNYYLVAGVSQLRTTTKIIRFVVRCSLTQTQVVQELLLFSGNSHIWGGIECLICFGSYDAQ